MKKNYILGAALVATGLMLGGCASSGSAPASSSYPSSPAYSSSYGVIDSIQVAHTSSGSGGALGTVAGGVVGGVLGNQVGGGRGRTAATVAGAVGGALIGNQMERNTQPQVQVYEIGVRLDNGSHQKIQQDTAANLQVGSRVRIENGRVYNY